MFPPPGPPPSSSSAPSAQRSSLPPSASNPLLAGSAFSLADSFGAAALLAPTPQPAQPQASGFVGSADAGSRPSPTPTPPTLSKASSSSSLTSSTNPLGPPPSGVFLLPASPPSATGPPLSTGPPPVQSQATSSAALGSGSARKSRYVAPPGIHASSSAAAPAMDGTTFQPPQQSSSQAVPAAVMVPAAAPTGEDAYAGQYLGEGSSFVAGPATPNVTTSVADLTPAQEVAHHWFYRVEVGSGNSKQEQWKPFTMIDSVAIEDVFLMDPQAREPIPVEGGRFDVCLPERTKTAVYWKQTCPAPIRRCSWFYKSNSDGRWTPYDEAACRKLEAEYADAMRTGSWNRRVDLGGDEHVMLHSPAVMMHFPSNAGAYLGAGNLDDWGQVRPPPGPAAALQGAQDAQLGGPRVVHRGLDGLPEIPDGEPPEVDHLVFVVHGVGAGCDIRLRPIAEVVDGYRGLSADLAQRHFQSAHLSGRASRVEFLPVNWHSPLHLEGGGTDERLGPLTLKSVPKLRGFVNETLLDILFYTSPVHCQKIIDTVVSEINRMFTLFMARNEGFTGSISVMGHSLGSLILFDVLSHQSPDDSLDVGRLAGTAVGGNSSGDHPAAIQPQAQHQNSVPGTLVLDGGTGQPATLEELFNRLGLGKYAETFTREGIDLEALKSCSASDLIEAGLPDAERQTLLAHLKRGTGTQASEGEGVAAGVTTSDFGYVMGRAGTGQPSIRYPRLCFQPAGFYALGSPIGMFQAVRGVEFLGPDFKFPTCPRFFNIFHPYDPVAYRVESLLDPEYAKLRPLVIPHHKGRKRMHLELKDTVTRLMTTDFKQKIIDSVSATLSTVYYIATGANQQEPEDGPAVQRALEDSMTKQAAEDDAADAANPRTLAAALNSGNRVDFVLQEAPFESFNEYLFAMASHLCYWESEDTALMILRDIYEQMSIYPDDAQFFRPPPPPVTTTNFAPTPTLAPPPIPMGGSMKGPAVLQTTTPTIAPPPVPMGGAMKGPAVLQTPTPTIAPPPTKIGESLKGAAVLQTTTPTIAPPPTRMGEPMPGPATLQADVTPTNTSMLQASALAAPPATSAYNSSTPVVPPASSAAAASQAPHMFSPSAGNGPSPIEMPMMSGVGSSTLGPPPVMRTSAVAGSPYPQPSRAVGGPAPPPMMGMDPTAPPSTERPLGPPPMGGFYKKT